MEVLAVGMQRFADMGMAGTRTHRDAGIQGHGDMKLGL